MCVIPVADTSSVDIVTVNDARIVARDQINATGSRRNVDHDGCRGWERAEWSADAQRLFLQSEVECAGGVKRATTGIIATASNGDWLDIVGVTMRENTAVRVLRRHSAMPLANLPDEVRRALPDGVTDTRLAARATVGDGEIIEAHLIRSAPPSLKPGWPSPRGSRSMRDAGPRSATPASTAASSTRWSRSRIRERFKASLRRRPRRSSL